MHTIYTAIRLSRYNAFFNNGPADLKESWLLAYEPVPLIPTVYRGNLGYRFPKTRRFISYRQLKKGLVKTTRTIRQPLNLLPF